MEYPGYGIYQADPANCDTLLECAQVVFSFVTKTMGYLPQDVLLMGRSIGSGPACFLASQYPKVAALILLSPFTSLKDAVKTYLGKLPAMLVRDRFINRHAIQKVECPTLLVHGMADRMVPPSHS